MRFRESLVRAMAVGLMLALVGTSVPVLAQADAQLELTAALAHGDQGQVISAMRDYMEAHYSNGPFIQVGASMDGDESGVAPTREDGPCGFAALHTEGRRRGQMRVRFFAACRSAQTISTRYETIGNEYESNRDRFEITLFEQNLRYNGTGGVREIGRHEYYTNNRWGYLLTGTTRMNGGMIPDSIQHPFNKTGDPYPRLGEEGDDRPGVVPFPNESQFRNPRTPNRGRFVNECVAEYDANGWLYKEGRMFENHHIIPAAFGGPDTGDNCYRLYRRTHWRFTAWWSNFGTPVHPNPRRRGE